MAAEVSSSGTTDKQQLQLQQQQQLAARGIPLTRVRSIMKSSQESGQIGQDATLAVAKATECFVAYLVKESYNQKGLLEYKDLSDLVTSKTHLKFLAEIVPKKVKASDYLASLKSKGLGGGGGGSQ
ncbi:chromatin accessibility complex protein 1-like [Oscarella lobularis]|uniref:chromatin accessibility complex protein 1-like n=1 Tax=Oscarella lobularis TaxID=121494 RepID=UPI003313BBAD